MFCFVVLRGGGAFGERVRGGEVVEIQGKEGERRRRGRGRGMTGYCLMCGRWSVVSMMRGEGKGRRRIGGCKEAAAGRAREMRGGGGRRGEMGMALARRGGGV